MCWLNSGSSCLKSRQACYFSNSLSFPSFNNVTLNVFLKFYAYIFWNSDVWSKHYLGSPIWNYQNCVSRICGTFFRLPWCSCRDHTPDFWKGPILSPHGTPPCSLSQLPRGVSWGMGFLGSLTCPLAAWKAIWVGCRRVGPLGTNADVCWNLPFLVGDLPLPAYKNMLFSASSLELSDFPSMMCSWLHRSGE